MSRASTDRRPKLQSRSRSIAGIVLAIAGVWAWALYPERPATRDAAQTPEAAKRVRMRPKKADPPPDLLGQSPELRAMPPELRAALAAADEDPIDSAPPPAAPIIPPGPMGGAARPRTHAPVYVDAGAMRAVLAFAREDGSCRRGHAAACADLDAAGGRLQLGRFEAKLEGACGGGQLSACRQRAELDRAAGDFEKAATWYKKMRVAATTIHSRCNDHLETRLTVCREAADALRLAASKEAELQRLRLAH